MPYRSPCIPQLYPAFHSIHEKIRYLLEIFSTGVACLQYLKLAAYFAIYEHHDSEMLKMPTALCDGFLLMLYGIDN